MKRDTHLGTSMWSWLVIYDKPITQELKSFHEGLGENALWRQFEPMILKENHRQSKDGKAWIETLNRLRVGIVTPEDEALLRTRLTNEEFLLEEAFHIFYYNKFVTKHNNDMLKKLLSKLISVKALQDLPKGRKPYEKKAKEPLEKLNLWKLSISRLGLV